MNTQLSPIIKKTFSETVQLTGHKSELYTGKFSKDGELYATAGTDRDINIWQTFHPQMKNISLFPSAHGNSILELCWGESNEHLYSCSVDKTIKKWDIYESKQERKFKDHKGFINSIDVYNDNIIASVGDDGDLILNDTRAKKIITQYKFNYPLTSVKFTLSGDEIFIGGIDNQIKKFVIKSNTIDINSSLIGHTDTVTGISISHGGNFLLSNSMDNSLCIWDIRPYVKGGNRLMKILRGNVHNFEKNLLRCAWSNDDNFVSCGSADRCVHIWEVDSGNIVNNLYGHNGSVNEVDFNYGNNDIIASVSSDHTAIIGKFNIV